MLFCCTFWMTTKLPHYISNYLLVFHSLCPISFFTSFFSLAECCNNIYFFLTQGQTKFLNRHIFYQTASDQVAKHQKVFLLFLQPNMHKPAMYSQENRYSAVDILGLKRFLLVVAYSLNCLSLKLFFMLFVSNRVCTKLWIFVFV